VIRAPVLDPEVWLERPLADLFYGQAPPDQRHASRVAAWLVARGHVDRLLIQAALLHDVGKAAAPIGLWQRVVWVIVGRAAPRRRGWLASRGGGWRALAAHQAIGAGRLRAIGADPRLAGLVAARPLPGDEHRAELLARADDAV
jgi:hypothetical protein